MEPHPIPQNVTAFQFKLVGDMTLKQFLYLATGLVIAYMSFVFLSANQPLLAWPIIILSSFLGVAFAFMPISDRPLDHWIAAFLKAVYSPTKRDWNKNGKNYTQEPLFARRLLIFQSATTPPISTLQFQAPQTPIKDLPSKEELQKTVELAREAQTLQTKIIETQKELSQTNYPMQINQIQTNLNELTKEAVEIKQEIAQIQHQSTPNSLPITEQATIKIVPSNRAKQTQIVLTSQPNIINGIISDFLGNYLENTVVVIYDKEGLPVRALKTNKLGQFTGSTPLPSGTYTVELERDNLTFDTLQIELTGNILPPLLVAPKKTT